jgi:hypothetical protein
VRQKATGELSSKSKFRQTILNRLEDWQPIQALWSSGGSKPIVVHPAQMRLQLQKPLDEGNFTTTPPHLETEKRSPGTGQTSPSAEHPGPLAEQGVRLEDSNNPNQQSTTTTANAAPSHRPTLVFFLPF